MRFMKETMKRVMPYVKDEAGAKRVIRMVLQSIASSLINDQEVQIRRFGTFKVVRSSARIARNPKTNVQITLPPKDRIRFKPSDILKKVVQEGRRTSSDKTSAE